MKCSFDISNFLEKTRKISLVFPILLLSSIFLHCSLKVFFFFLISPCSSLEIFPFLPCPFISLLYSAICKASPESHFAFLHFFFFGMVLVTTFYTVLQTSVYSSSGTLSTITNPLGYFPYLHCIIIRDFMEVIPELSSGFPYFLQFKPEFFNNEHMISFTDNSRSIFIVYVELIHLQLQRI